MALDWLFTKTTLQACWPPQIYLITTLSFLPEHRSELPSEHTLEMKDDFPGLLASTQILNNNSLLYLNIGVNYLANTP
jgi:hypothetical protein